MGKRIPIGLESYKQIVDGDYYYIDKTLFAKEILDGGASVTLFTRPRRFGKTLALSMLQTFFEDERDEGGQKIDNSHYFAGKKIADCGEKYQFEMGKYPVLHLTFKSAKQPSYEMAYESLKGIIGEEFRRHQYILQGDALYEDEVQKFRDIVAGKAKVSDYATALVFLTKCLKRYHNSNVIILLDEYDVPLENAYFRGFYDRMVDFIRSLLESVLKTNDSLAFSVITGCLRISKESIFTGLNNLRVISILNRNFTEFFGFTVGEVEKMLADYGLLQHLEEIKKWYDGYLFGGTEIYNPWSIINCVNDNYNQVEFVVEPYWANTSSNDIVRELVEGADASTRMEIECLMAGEVIEKPVYEDITYGEIHRSSDSIWSFLFFTGYLRKAGERFENRKRYLGMRIPNEEILSIYENTILSWFDAKIKDLDRSVLLRAIEAGDCGAIGTLVSEQLQDTISFFDYAENYYHGFLAGLLKGMGKYQLVSNRESGSGRPDLMMRAPSLRGKAFVFEIKVAGGFRGMRAGCKRALAQAARKDYRAELRRIGYSDITVYGVCFFRKECRVLKE